MNDDSFFSLDRLVEFGLGINVANQMMKMMSESFRNMYVPGADNVIKQKSELYYAMINGEQTGPYSESELSRLIIDKKINTDTYMWRPGMISWKKASELPEVLKLVALTPPQFNG